MRREVGRRGVGVGVGYSFNCHVALQQHKHGGQFDDECQVIHCVSLVDPCFLQHPRCSLEHPTVACQSGCSYHPQFSRFPLGTPGTMTHQVQTWKPE